MAGSSDLFSKYLLYFFLNVFRKHKKEHTIVAQNFRWKTICSLNTNKAVITDNAAALEKLLILCASKMRNTSAEIFLEALTADPRAAE